MPAESSPPPAQPPVPLSVRTLPATAVDARTEQAWRQLEERALESNAYLSPCFILAAVRHLDEGPPPIIVVVETPAADVVGVGVFTLRRATRRVPVPHLAAYRSCHSYLTGLLVDRDRHQEVLSAFFDFFCGPESRWHGVDFSWRTADGPFAEALDAAAAAHGSVWRERSRRVRALLAPARAGEAYLETEIKGSRAKNLRRQMRRLREQGEVGWRVKRGLDDAGGAAERFLDLEHRGWKGAEGTSLRSKPAEEAFFRDTIDRFSKDGRAWFTELLLDGAVIASTVNFVSGDAGFAFKIGWDPDHARLSPGLLNEIELIRRAPEVWGHLAYVDSGAGEGSYIDELWMGRRVLTSGTYATTAIGRSALALTDGLRRLKRTWRGPA